MKASTFISIIFLLFQTSFSKGNFYEDYFKNRYVIRMVEHMPLQLSNKILIISTRNIKPEDNYVIKRGIHPKYSMFIFIAGIKHDTAFILPMKNLDEVTQFLPVDRDFLVYVDGHGKTFAQAMERGFELTERFDINLVLFDWPSDYFALRKTVYNADEVSVSFIRAMIKLEVLHKKYYQSSAVSVIFHSMGNRILKDISHPKMIGKMPPQLFSNIIINAAAVKEQNHSKWVERLIIQKRVYITLNEMDYTLRGANFLRLAEQLGTGIRKLAARNAFYVNFSSIATEEHNLFLGKSSLEKTNPEIFVFYDLAFHGKEVKLGDNSDLQILSPSELNFLFSVK